MRLDRFARCARDRQTDRQTDRKRERERERDSERQRERERERQREIERQREARRRNTLSVWCGPAPALFTATSDLGMLSAIAGLGTAAK